MLRHWLEEKYGQFPNKGEALVNATCDILGVERSSLEGNMAALRMGVQLSELCRQVRRDAAELPEHLHPQLLLADFHRVEAAIDHFTMSRQHQLSAMLDSINPAGYRGLEFLDTFLHSNLRHPYIDEETRADLIEQVRELMDGVTEDPDFDVETKDFLLTRLEEVEAALREALLTGTVRIERATESLIGAMHRRPDLWDRIAATKWGPRVKNIAVGLCMALSAAGGLPALMPGDPPGPTAIVQETHLEVNVTNDEVTVDRGSGASEEEVNVVDAELVDEGDETSER